MVGLRLWDQFLFVEGTLDVGGGLGSLPQPQLHLKKSPIPSSGVHKALAAGRHRAGLIALLAKVCQGWKGESIEAP